MKDEQSDPKRRETGYYWVKLYGLESWYLSNWAGGVWWLPGNEIERVEESIMEVDERRVDRRVMDEISEKDKRIAELESALAIAWHENPVPGSDKYNKVMEALRG